ncbi:MAG: hypothetical protein ACF8R9_01595 [Phycisphaerales bacterium JB054]
MGGSELQPGDGSGPTPRVGEQAVHPVPEPASSPAGDARAVDLDVFGRPAPAGRDWAHRRGEPRIFAFFWTLYLLLATVGAFWTAGAPGSHDALAMRPAARSLLAAITVGIALLWPMTRLSQSAPSERPRRIARAIVQDMMVLLIPAQAVIWPQIAMSAWPVPVVAALAASLAAWTLVIGGVLAMGLYLTGPGSGRGWWMLVLVALAGLGPLVAIGPLGGAAHGDGSFDWWWMTSPVTSGFEISRDRLWTGASAAVSVGHWRSIGVVGLAGAVVWVMFGAAGLFRRTESA